MFGAMPMAEAGRARADEAPRNDRTSAIAFVTDAQCDAALRDGLGDVLPAPIELRRGGIRAAIAAQQKAPNPRVLVVDVSGESEPLQVLSRLSLVVEPDTCVLVIGETSDLTLYREITHGLGVGEYLAKPLTRDMVARFFGPLVRGQSPGAEVMLGGKFITVTGARGGVGASVIAASLAWHFAMTARRHTVLLDGDLYRGTAALLLQADPGEGLRKALESPERIDMLLAERAAQPVADRLHVLSSQDSFDYAVQYAPGAADRMLAALRRRYNLVVADVPWQPDPFSRDLLAAAGRRVIVLTPTLPGLRDTLRLLALPGASNTIVALNRLGMPGGLKRQQVEDALRRPPDVVIPDLPRQVAAAVTMGEPASRQGGAFRAGIAALLRQLDHGREAEAGPSGIAARPKPHWRLFGPAR
ncbi:MAG TPA: pilus assembly protein [Acetobacteraceae bacterium]|nr:pilus assembly protein [Acetobacteraceae bacterium]